MIAKNEPQAVKGSVEALHRIRVALRRMRSLAMTFSKLDGVFLDRLNRRASKVCDRMGGARDLDVWIDLYRSMMKVGGLQGVLSRDRRAVMGVFRRERTRLAAEALTCGTFRRVKEMLRKYLRRRRPVRRKKPPSPEAFVARRMLVVRRTDRGAVPAGREFFASDPAHDLRRAGRRLRYLSEFFAPRLGPGHRPGGPVDHEGAGGAGQGARLRQRAGTVPGPAVGGRPGGGAPGAEEAPRRTTAEIQNRLAALCRPAVAKGWLAQLEAAADECPKRRPPGPDGPGRFFIPASGRAITSG